MAKEGRGGTGDAAGGSAGAVGLKTELSDLLDARDKAGAVARALEAIDSGVVDIPALYAEVLTPILIETGALWQAGRTAVWREHWVSAAVRTIIEALYPRVAKMKAEAVLKAVPVSRAVDPIVLLACPPEEAHDLGLRMLADRFELKGWDAVFLGADTPEEEIVRAAREVGAKLVVMSAATHFHRLRIRHVADCLDRELPEVRVRVTGRAFEKDHDGWRDDEVLIEADLDGGA